MSFLRQFQIYSFVLLVLGIFLFVGTPTLHAEAGIQHLVVDFSQDEGPVTHKGSGFLHGMSAIDPPDSALAPLRPKLFRNAAQGVFGAFETYPRLQWLGANSQIVISDTYGYQKGFPGVDRDYSRLEGVVLALLEEAEKRGQRHQWDIWNEPDLKHFWGGSREQFFEVWKRAVRMIRKRDPTSTIVGPSINAYKLSFLKPFLQFARDENVLPDILAWHEILGKKPPRIVAHVEEMRKYLKEQNLPIYRIQINEHTSIKLKFKPGAAVWFLSQLETSKVDGAAKACWRDGSKKSNCQTATIGGLVTIQSKRPRPLWWVYKSYGDMEGSLAKVLPTSSVNGLVAYDDREEKVLGIFGRMGGEGITEIHFKNLDRIFESQPPLQIQVRAVRIPFIGDGRGELLSLTEIYDANFKVQDGGFVLPIQNLGPHDAYRVEMSKS